MQTTKHKDHTNKANTTNHNTTQSTTNNALPKYITEANNQQNPND